MVLVSLILFMKTFYPEDIENFREKFKVDNSKPVNNVVYNKSVRNSMTGYSFMLFFILLNVVPALIIALNCNSGIIGKILVVPFAILFSDIYIFWYVFRQFILKSRGYCVTPMMGPARDR